MSAPTARTVFRATQFLLHLTAGTGTALWTILHWESLPSHIAFRCQDGHPTNFGPKVALIPLLAGAAIVTVGTAVWALRLPKLLGWSAVTMFSGFFLSVPYMILRCNLGLRADQLAGTLLLGALFGLTFAIWVVAKRLDPM